MGNPQWELVKTSAAFDTAYRSLIQEILGFQIGPKFQRWRGGGASQNSSGGGGAEQARIPAVAGGVEQAQKSKTSEI